MRINKYAVTAFITGAINIPFIFSNPFWQINAFSLMACWFMALMMMKE